VGQDRYFVLSVKILEKARKTIDFEGVKQLREKSLSPKGPQVYSKVQHLYHSKPV